MHYKYPYNKIRKRMDFSITENINYVLVQEKNDKKYY